MTELDVFYTILGGAMLYSIGHFFFIQHSIPYSKRTTYQRVVTWTGIVVIILIILGVMYG